ncbi:hypothetical protein ES703_55629 [subsurface metagenome]
MEKQNPLSHWLKERMETENLSLRKAALLTELSHGTLADIQRGVSPTAETVRKLAQGFGGGSALQDHLLSLAGYRAPGADEPSGALAELIDQVRQFDDRQLRMMTQFAKFLTGL